MFLSQPIKRFFRRVGVDLRRYNAAQSEGYRVGSLLRLHAVNMVYDVGANAGQYGRMLRENGYTGSITSFEPVGEAHLRLVAAAAGDPKWEVAPRVAIGARDGLVQMNVAANSTSSSVLPMMELHRTVAPESIYQRQETVPMMSLDGFAAGKVTADTRLFLKIDTQGYEAMVLAGAKETLPRVVGIQLELSLVPLYEQQKLYLEMIQSLENEGFRLWGLTPGFIDQSSGRLLQFDGIFFRPTDN